MHFAEPTSGCSVTVKIFADGISCPENLFSNDNGNQQCWIAVKAGQTLSIQCTAEMISKKYQVDLIVDGILRNSWLSSEVSKVQTRTASIEFSEACVKEVRSLRMCSLTTSSLQNETADFQRSEPIKVGTIEIQISKTDRDFTHTQTAPLPDQGSRGWDAPGIAVVPPTHEIIYLNGKNLSESDRRAIRKKMKKPRPGRSPWATFCFHYRLEESLRDANLLNAVIPAKTITADANAPGIDNRTPPSPARSDTTHLAHPSQKSSRLPHTNSPEPESFPKATELKHQAASAATPISASTVSARTAESRVGSGKSHRITLPDPGPAGSAADDENIVVEESSSTQKRTFSSIMDDQPRDYENTPACKHCGKPYTPNLTEDHEALEAYIKILQDKRDAKRRKTAEEQNKTETMALQLEGEKVHSHEEDTWDLKAELERDIEKCDEEIAAQQREQKELTGIE